MMSIPNNEIRLIDEMSSNGGQVTAFIIGCSGTPHGKGDLNPGVGKTPESILELLTFITLPDIKFLSPIAVSDGAEGKLLKGVSAKLTCSLSKADDCGLSRLDGVWTCSPKLLGLQ